jgi:hypothetical protein
MNQRLKKNKFKFLRESKIKLGLLASASILFNTAFAAKNTPIEIISTQIKTSLSFLESEQIELNSTSEYEKYIPIQSIQYSHRVVHHSETEKVTAGITQESSLRLNLKSYQEIKSFSDSERLTTKGAKLSQLENLNQKNALVYEGFTFESLNWYLLKLFSSRKIEVESAIQQKGDLAGANLIKVKDLLDELVNLQKIETEKVSLLKTASSETSAVKSLNPESLDGIVQYLIASVKGLHAQLIGYVKIEIPISTKISQKGVEIQLERIKKETSWANDEKLFDHFEYQRDPYKNENSFKIGINVPWIRFDNQTRNQEKVLLKINEEAFGRERLNSSIVFQNKMKELDVQVIHIDSAKPKFEKLKILEGQFRGQKDIAMLTSLAQLKFEMEKELLSNTLNFYRIYFEVIKDFSGFAVLANKNLLDSHWAPL